MAKVLSGAGGAGSAIMLQIMRVTEVRGKMMVSCIWVRLKRLLLSS
jgi:hypothetical protein